MVGWWGGGVRAGVGEDGAGGFRNRLQAGSYGQKWRAAAMPPKQTRAQAALLRRTLPRKIRQSRGESPA